MDFRLSPELEDLRQRVATFVEAEIMPLEKDPANYDHHENIAAVPLAATREKARGAGLWAPQMPVERGGLGLNTVGMAVFYEAAARSIFGPVCLNCAPPDDGNMFLLNRVAREDQKDRQRRECPPDHHVDVSRRWTGLHEERCQGHAPFPLR